jgi:hypothetical protein
VFSLSAVFNIDGNRFGSGNEIIIIIIIMEPGERSLYSD